MNTISNSELQKNIGKISHIVENDYLLVNNRGKQKMVILPYFEENEDLIADYMEDYFIYKNKKKLQKEAEDSLKSGLSDLVI